jgi:hypothetical protein
MSDNQQEDREDKYEEKDPEKRRAAFIEHTIRQNMREGFFENVEGTGQPLSWIDKPYDELWWVKQLVEREKLSILPESLELRREIEQKLQEIRSMTQERFVREELEALNAKIRRANATTIQGPPTVLVPINIEAVVAKWKAERERK